MVAGFQPPEAVRDFNSRDQANLAVVYPPGKQVDPSITVSAGQPAPWRNRDWNDFTSEASKFTVPKQSLNGARGGGWWPPKPTAKVTFMPTVREGDGDGRRLHAAR